MKAVKCPVCEGAGWVRKYKSNPEGTAIESLEGQSCHGCDGKGWVEVSGEN